ncbi:MAG: hypothetical protein RLZZ135_1301 [Cyanobacteriota bacterium]|jgi:trk system potassium uptake protein TrkH
MNIARTICLGFLCVILVGTIVLMLPIAGTSDTWNSPLVALFTSTSAVCVTGLSIVEIGTYFSFWGQLVIAIEAQVGGLGYMTLTTFLMLLLARKFDFGQKLSIKAVFDRSLLQASKSLITSIISTTLIFEILGAICLFPIFVDRYGIGQGLWYAIFHSISAWNNAGFTLFKDNSIGNVDSILFAMIVSGLIIFGGIGYQTIVELYLAMRHRLLRQPGRFFWSLNFKVVVSTTILLLVVGTVAIFLTEHRNHATIADLDVGQQLMAAWFQSVTSRTAGFHSIDPSKMTVASMLVTIGLMFIGASPSGTGGGIKTTTFGILASTTCAALQRKSTVVMFARSISTELLIKAVAVVFASVSIIILATMAILLGDSNFGAIPVLFEVVSAFANVGLSLGITARLSEFNQLILVVTMYTGRIGILLLISALFGTAKPSAVKYAADNLWVG